MAPHDVLLNLFEALADQPTQEPFRYVLGLLLLRRRIVKLHETRCDSAGEVMVLDCPLRNAQFEMRVAPPPANSVGALQQRLIDLVYGGI
ncbi:MAG TPA: hypothetical protein PJ982_03015 [Lacipirellulaceae bacterium]|nr:hypothetical protein [Lacipirellulaceae bacterium]